MNITWVEFYNPFKMSGGGPTVNRKIIKAARNLGHNINVISYKNVHDIVLEFAQSDLFVLCDIFNEPQHPRDIPISVIRQIIDDHTFIKMDNSYVDVCRHRWGHCLWRNKQSCLFDADIVQDMYREAKARIFVSPLHRDVILSQFSFSPDLNFVTYIPLDPMFKPYDDINGNRSIEYLHVGTICHAKGWNNIQHHFSDQKSIVIGPWRHNSSPPRTWREPVERECLPDIYRSSKNFIHKPNWPEPCSLTTREAEACGCNLDTNDRVGYLSFDGQELLPDQLWGNIFRLL